MLTPSRQVFVACLEKTKQNQKKVPFGVDASYTRRSHTSTVRSNTCGHLLKNVSFPSSVFSVLLSYHGLIGVYNSKEGTFGSGFTVNSESSDRLSCGGQ